MFRQEIAYCCDYQPKRVNEIGGITSDVLNVKADDAYAGP
jgi:hypothetical protein